ncbi:hypothetical protein [Botrytis cinerea binarnavirus 2]|uniref:Uncharacterized protein n=1 Tax=Botrytis cinerea binarnavirus 2 TaxID=2800199 RepID=A0A7D5FKV5_9VIRU|nr:hypothetical protein [Botrytis cinerea binarnavirus 2]
MSSNVRKNRRPIIGPIRFTESPLSVYDVEEWDPTEFLDEDMEYGDTLDLDEIEQIGRSSAIVLTEHNIRHTPIQGASLIGEEVGDDRCDRTRDPGRAATALVVQEAVMEMKTSEMDTFISRHYFNFCEVTSTVPSTPDQSFDKCRKVNAFENLGYVDVPPLRIILDVSKGDGSHSSTTPGKATMLGNRMRTPRSEFLQDFYLASYLQDGMLRTNRSTEPKYLPQIMGGSGVRAPFGESDNLYLSVHAYRGGGYQRVYGTATSELAQCLDLLERGQASMPVFCHRLRDKQEYLHGTYAEKVLIPTTRYMDQVMGRLPAPFITASGGANRFVNYENRLERTRHLVSRSVAVREWGFTTRIRDQLLSHWKVPDSDSALALARARGRKEFGFALSANSAFKNLLDRKATPRDVQELIQQEFLVVNTGVTEFSKYDAQWLFHGGKKETFSIGDLTCSEDMFLREEVSEEETFKVGGIRLDAIGVRNLPPQMTTTRVGLYQIGSTMTEWADSLVNRLKNIREEGIPLTPDKARQVFLEDPEWVNDDTGLIDRCLHDTGQLHYRSSRVVLVSDDRRLANQMAQTCQTQVIRIPSIDYILWSIRRGTEFQSTTGDTVAVSGSLSRRGTQRKDPVRAVYVDTGSIASAAARLQREANPDGEDTVFLRQVLQSGLDERGRRYVHYNLVDTKLPVDLKSTLHEPISRPRRFRMTENQSGSWSTTRPGGGTRPSPSSKSNSWR